MNPPNHTDPPPRPDPRVVEARRLIETGLVDFRGGRLAKAEAAYRQALKVVPGHPRALHLLGMIAHQIGRHAAAVKLIRQAIKRRPNVPLFHNNLGNALRQSGDCAASVKAYERAIALKPDMSEAHSNMGLAYFELGQIDESLAAHNRALELKPNSVMAKWGAYLTLPVLYDHEADIDRHRERWRGGVETLLGELDLGTPAKAREAANAVTLMTNFYLSFQGRNDIAEQTLYGQLLHRIASAAYPGARTAAPARVRKPGDKIRVGFVSYFLYWHSVYKTHGRWITGLDRERFEIHTFYTGKRFDESTQAVKDASDAFHNNLHDNSQRAAMIAKSELDVLVYLDIGMHPDMQLLGALRLAPIQCVAGGHPVTSGLPTIDYYLSSDLMEPDDADGHYTETLVRLPNLANCYPALEVPKVERKRRRGETIFLCSHSLYTQLPQHDQLFVRIAKAVPKSVFWFVADRAVPVTEQFHRRLAKAFTEAGIDADDRLVVHPRMDHQDFLAFNCKADILLDTLLWSGHNSTFDSMACGLPIVTLPGPMMRGRHTYAILKMMGIDELIATDEDDYVAIATRLATDGRWRRRMVKKIADRAPSIFEDEAPVRAFEDFLEGVCPGG